MGNHSDSAPETSARRNILWNAADALLFSFLIDRYFQPLGPDDAETAYQFRNALIHSFGLFSESRTKAYHFGMSMNGTTLIKPRPNDRYTIDVYALQKRFEDSVLRFQSDMDADATLQAHFATMFPKYGSIRYGG